MADKKITALDDLGTALADVDLFHIVDDPSNTPINKRVSAKNVFKSYKNTKAASKNSKHTNSKKLQNNPKQIQLKSQRKKIHGRWRAPTCSRDACAVPLRRRFPKSWFGGRRIFKSDFEQDGHRGNVPETRLRKRGSHRRLY